MQSFYLKVVANKLINQSIFKNNLQVFVKNVHIFFKDLHGHRNQPSRWGKCSHLFLDSTN